VARHVTVLGLGWLAYSALHLLPILARIGLVHTGLPFYDDIAGAYADILRPVSGEVGAMFSGATIAGLIAGGGLMARASWARKLAIVLGCINLVLFPLGTVLGIYTFWVLAPQGARAQYQTLARAPVRADRLGLLVTVIIGFAIVGIVATRREARKSNSPAEVNDISPAAAAAAHAGSPPVFVAGQNVASDPSVLSNPTVRTLQDALQGEGAVNYRRMEDCKYTPGCTGADAEPVFCEELAQGIEARQTGKVHHMATGTLFTMSFDDQESLSKYLDVFREDRNDPRAIQLMASMQRAGCTDLQFISKTTGQVAKLIRLSHFPDRKSAKEYLNAAPQQATTPSTEGPEKKEESAFGTSRPALPRSIVPSEPEVARDNQQKSGVGNSAGHAEGNGQFQNLQPNFSTEGPLILSDTRGVDFGPYVARVVYVVRRNWYLVIPESARLGGKGQVGIVFEILKNGDVPQVRLVASSGSEPLDRAALASIHSSIPFPTLPEEFTGNHLVLQFMFRYNTSPGR
jgi:TonB family protein